VSTSIGTAAEVEARPTVIVIGAINVDLVVRADRLPGPGETVVGGSMRSYGGGKGANAAVAAARSGALTYFIGAVGDDDTGSAALAELAEEGIDVSGVAHIAGVTTGVALIVVAASGENQIAVGAGANMELSADHVRCELRRLLPAADWVLISTEITPDAVIVAVDTTAAAGVPCLINPAPVIPAVLEVLDRGPVLTPNEGELADLARALGVWAADGDNHPGRAAQAVVARTGAAVVVTRGGDGLVIVEPGKEPAIVAARVAAVRDTTGAGDTFNGVLAGRLAAGDDLRRAVDVANAAAALSTEAVGARTGMPHGEALTGPVEH
jgi:ribokinase